MKKSSYQLSAFANYKNYGLLATAAILGSCANQSGKKDSNEYEFKGKLGKTLKETTQWWPEYKAQAPKDAPNVIYILIDDIGYGASSAFGGLIPTPNIDSLANNGLRYTNFHTNAISSPTRAALLTGRNSHSVHDGNNSGAGTPGYDRIIPFTKGFASEILRENGYNTFAVGKWHLTPKQDHTQSGPFNRWPTGRGFDKYFGFLNAATDQYHPILWDGTNKFEKDDNDKRLLSELITDKAINYIAEQKSATPEKPFFLYFAPGATHSPHQVDKVWSDKFKGKFDKGWDWYREQVLANQKKLGVVHEYVQLPPSNPGVKPWDNISNDQKKLFIRHFEVYAGYLAQIDNQIGRLVNYLRDIDQLDNTLIFLSIGDNGASKGGAEIGNIRPYSPKLSAAEKLQKNIDDIDLIGTDESNVNYPFGWAQAANTPFRYWKTDANSEGGTHNPLIVYWPKRIKEKGIRTQYSHVIDILPTTLELIGAKIPDVINGHKQDVFEGTSFAYTIEDAKAPGRHTVQYFEIAGSRAIYKDGWKAGALHVKGNDFDKDKWELYKLDEDFNERFDLAEKNPTKLEELKKLFEEQAWKYNVFPLKDGSEKEKAGEPGLFDDKKQVILYPGISQLTETPNLSNRSFAVTAVVDLTAKSSEGVLFSIGGKLGGFSLFVQNGKLQAEQNVSGYETNSIVADKSLTATGKTDLTFEFVNSPEQGKELATNSNSGSGVGILYVNGIIVAKTHFSSASFRGTYEGISVGKDIITPVSKKYKIPYAYTGTLKKIIIDLK